jgi:hypothetical protein
MKLTGRIIPKKIFSKILLLALYDTSIAPFVAWSTAEMS